MRHLRTGLMIFLAAIALAACSKSSSGGDATPGDAGPMVDTAPMCTAEHAKRCIDGHPTWTDSCGTIGERQATCNSGQRCEEGECVCANEMGEVKCHGNDVFRFNGCDEPVYRVEACGANETCREGVCVNNNCTPSEERCDGQDNDCDGTTDEGDLCPNGVSCMDAVCGEVGGLCSPCEETEDCQPNHTCAGYSNFPDLNRVCVPTGCTSDEQCPENTRCNDDGLCWLRWQTECRDGDSWNIDTCGRAVSVAETCDPGTQCQDGRCVGEGELCTDCEGNGDCALGFLCRSYSSYPHVPSVCVPQSNCNDAGGQECPEGLQCSASGVCWLTWTSQCQEDGDPWSIDTCGRTVVRADECAEDALCADGRCIGMGSLCDECTGDSDCGAGYLCRGYNNFPEIPQICVPESDCATNPESMCPEGYQCGGSGVCWMNWVAACGEDLANVYNADNCGRFVSVLEECPADQHCEEGACVPGGPPPVPDAGAPPADAGALPADAGVPAPAPDGQQ